MLINEAWAQAGAPPGADLWSMMPIVLMFVVLYFLMIRPQQKKMKEHKKMLEAIKKGDEIVTAGGIYGTVDGVNPDTLTVKIAEGVKVKITRGSVGDVVKPEGEKK